MTNGGPRDITYITDAAGTRPRRQEKKIRRRIRSTAGKIFYTLTVITVVIILGSTVYRLLPTVPRALVAGIFFLLTVWTGTRLFRGLGESDDPRQWWRATAGSKSGYVVGALFVLWSASFLLNIFLALRASSTNDAIAALIQVLSTALVAFFFFRSAVRSGAPRGSDREK